jgi:hypothetical protein
MNEALSLLLLFSLWNLLILAAIYRVSLRAVNRAKEEAIQATMSFYAAQPAPARKRIPKKEVAPS